MFSVKADSMLRKIRSITCHCTLGVARERQVRRRGLTHDGFKQVAAGAVRPLDLIQRQPLITHYGNLANHYGDLN
eukprot:scaffold338892_cov14-Prasinocladus_malaysianus.AAC.1